MKKYLILCIGLLSISFIFGEGKLGFKLKKALKKNSQGKFRVIVTLKEKIQIKKKRAIDKIQGIEKRTRVIRLRETIAQKQQSIRSMCHRLKGNGNIKKFKSFW